MEFRELTSDQCHDVLRRARIGRLGCAKDGQPYVLPIHFGFDGGHLYGFATVGQKVEWMRANPRVCLEVDEIADFNEWTSVIVFGRYEELDDRPEWEEERRRASLLLDSRAKWSEPGYAASRFRDRANPLAAVLYAIRVEEITGRRAEAGSWGLY